MPSAVMRIIRSVLAMHLENTTSKPLVWSFRSSRTRKNTSQSLTTLIEDRGQTVSRRSKLSSRTTLIGEQPNPWDLLQPQDVKSQHRGAKQLRR